MNGTMKIHVRDFNCHDGAIRIETQIEDCTKLDAFRILNGVCEALQIDEDDLMVYVLYGRRVVRESTTTQGIDFKQIVEQQDL